jgi:hypothetical protein
MAVLGVDNGVSKGLTKRSSLSRRRSEARRDETRRDASIRFARALSASDQPEHLRGMTGR